MTFDELNEKEQNAVQRLWFGSNNLLVESSSSKWCLRPRLVKGLVEKGLVALETVRLAGGTRVVRLTEAGHDLCLENDNDWDENPLANN